jgi:hypothetical protein
MSDYVRAIDPPALEKAGQAKFGPDYAVPPHVLVQRGGVPEEGWVRYKEDDHHHWTVWRTNDFLELVKVLGFNVVEVQDTDDKVGNGFTVVMRK